MASREQKELLDRGGSTAEELECQRTAHLETVPQPGQACDGQLCDSDLDLVRKTDEKIHEYMKIHVPRVFRWSHRWDVHRQCHIFSHYW